jgi:hypothetical protein
LLQRRLEIRREPDGRWRWFCHTPYPCVVDTWPPFRLSYVRLLGSQGGRPGDRVPAVAAAVPTEIALAPLRA